MMESLWRDLRFALRQMARERGFSIASILVLTLGIGAAATIFTVVNAILLKELPYRDPAQLVMIEGSFLEKGEAHTWPVSLTDFADWRKRCKAFSEMSVWGSFAFNIDAGQRSQRVWGELVNDSYFSLLKLKPALGRFFRPEEDAQPLQDFVVVLGYDLWRNAFGGDRTVLGRMVNLNGRMYQVIGVAPQRFRGMSDKSDLWVPSMLPPIPAYVKVRGLRWAAGVARLNPGVSPEQAQQQMNGVTTALAQEFPVDNQGFAATVTPLKDYWFGKLRSGLLILTVGAGILLLIACINIASLLLARAIAKQRVWAIRIALGARRQLLIRQLLTESLVLSLIGAVAGLVLSQWTIRALVAVSGTEFPSFIHVSAEPLVVVVTVGIAVACGLLFGLAPIWMTFRTELSQCLGREEKLTPRGDLWRWFQHGVVVAQVALALALSIYAILMGKGFYKLVNKDLGFKADNVVTFRVDVRNPRYFDDDVAAKLLREQYLPHIAAVPGIERMAMAVPTIPTDDWSGTFITIEDHSSSSPDGTYPAMVHAVSPGYFEILGIPIQKGRAFSMQDVQTNAVIVSKALADQQWPGQDPMGKRLKLAVRGRAEVPWLTVVGIASSVRHEGLMDDKSIPAPELYLSLLQFVRRPLTVNFLIHPKPGVSTGELRSALHREIMAFSPDFPDYDMATMKERLAKQAGKAKLMVVLISVFAVLSLALAAIGIYGVTSYGISQRTREIAIRMSLGAARNNIVSMVVGRGALLAGVGLLVGLLGVVIVSRQLSSLLYQTSVADPWILGGTSLGLFAVALAANFIPARRAASADPLVGMRLQ